MAEEPQPNPIRALSIQMATAAQTTLERAAEETRRTSDGFQAELDAVVSPLKKIEEKLRARAKAAETAQGLSAVIAIVSTITPEPDPALESVGEELGKLAILTRADAELADAVRKAREAVESTMVEGRDSAERILIGLRDFFRNLNQRLSSSP